MAAKKKATTKATRPNRTRLLVPIEYTVSVSNGQVVIDGSNGGNIYGEPDQEVTFTCGPGVTSFTFDAIELKKHGSSPAPARKWPFKGSEPTWPQSEFSGALKSPGSLKKYLFFKYSVSVTGANPLDPVIIVEK